MRSTLKSTLGAMFDSFGAHRAPQVPPAHQAMAAHLAALFKALAIDLVIDVGADQGQFGTLLRDRAGYTGQIASFESIPSLFTSLAERISADARWHVEHAALGEAAGELPLNVIDLQNFRTNGSAKPSSRPTPQSARVSRQTVPIRTLDHILPALRRKTGAKRVFLNLNAHAEDHAILRGSEQALGTITALRTGLFTNRQFEGVPHYLGMLTYFQTKHFLPHQIWSVSVDPATAPDRFECCLINTSHP
jgi:FkbM family methyltransferase